MPEAERGPKRDDRFNSETKPRVYAALQRASEIFHQNLLSNSRALKYVQSRGFKDETIEKYQMGFAPPSREVVGRLESEGFTLYEQILAGLARENQEQTYSFSFFKDRIVIPVLVNGRVSGFCGRYIGSDPDILKKMKYMNSPESPIYQKGRSFLGVPQANELLRHSPKLFVFEAAFDAPLIVQSGFPALATIGTAFTEEHARFLARYHDKQIVFVPQIEDSGIGEEATARALAKSFGRFNSAVALFPREGTKVDGADMVQQGRIAELRQIFSNTSDSLDFYLRIKSKGQDLSNEGVRTSLLKGIQWDFQQIPPEHYGNYAAGLAKRLGLERRDIEQIVYGRKNLTVFPTESEEPHQQQNVINGSALYWQTRFLKQLFASIPQQGVLQAFKDRLVIDEFNGNARKAAAAYLIQWDTSQQVFDIGNPLVFRSQRQGLCGLIEKCAAEKDIKVSADEIDRNFFGSFFRLDYQRSVTSPKLADISESYAMWRATRLTDETSRALSSGASPDRLVTALDKFHEQIGEVR